eukprot:gene3085-5859_t
MRHQMSAEKEEEQEQQEQQEQEQQVQQEEQEQEDALELSSEYGEQLTSGLARVGELAKAISKQDRFFREGKNLSVKSQKDRISETLKCFASAKRLSQEKQAIVGKLSSNVRMDKLLKHVESKLREFEAELEVTNPGCSQKLAEQSLSLDSQDAQRIESLPFSRPSRSSSSSTPSKPISSKLRKQKERAVQSEEEDTSNKT